MTESWTLFMIVVYGVGKSPSKSDRTRNDLNNLLPILSAVDSASINDLYQLRRFDLNQDPFELNTFARLTLLPSYQIEINLLISKLTCQRMRERWSLYNVRNSYSREQIVSTLKSSWANYFMQMIKNLYNVDPRLTLLTLIHHPLLLSKLKWSEFLFLD